MRHTRSQVQVPPHMQVDYVWGRQEISRYCTRSESEEYITWRWGYLPWFWNTGQTSPEVQNRCISGPTKRTNALPYSKKPFTLRRESSSQTKTVWVPNLIELRRHSIRSQHRLMRDLSVSKWRTLWLIKMYGRSLRKANSWITICFPILCG